MPEQQEAPAEAAPQNGGGGDAPEPGARRRRSWAALAVVCAPIFVLVVVLGIKWSRERRLRADCRRNLNLLHVRAEKYAAANGGFYPYGPRTLEMLMAQRGHRKFMVCAKSKRTYRWTLRRRKTTDPAHLLLAWENPGAVPHGVVGSEYFALFVGGKVRSLSPEKLRELLAAEAREPVTPPRRPRKPKPGLRKGPDVPLPPPGTKLPPGARILDPLRPPAPEKKKDK
jgi:hypothetical protein